MPSVGKMSRDIFCSASPAPRTMAITNTMTVIGRRNDETTRFMLPDCITTFDVDNHNAPYSWRQIVCRSCGGRASSLSRNPRVFRFELMRTEERGIGLGGNGGVHGFGAGTGLGTGARGRPGAYCAGVQGWPGGLGCGCGSHLLPR